MLLKNTTPHMSDWRVERQQVYPHSFDKAPFIHFSSFVNKEYPLADTWTW